MKQANDLIRKLRHPSLYSTNIFERIVDNRDVCLRRRILLIDCARGSDVVVRLERETEVEPNPFFARLYI